MKLIRHINDIKKIYSGSVISIGNFDGIHIGHQQLFSKVCEIGKKNNIPTIIMTFEPQPLEFLNRINPPKRLMQFQHKIKYIQKWKIDIVLCVQFNRYFASLNAEEFIKKILIKKLNIQHIIIGNDFKFGSQKNGNALLLKKMGHQYQFNVIKINSVYYENIKISSTNIRKYLLQNKIKQTALLLGRPFSYFGRVVHGNKIGRTLGYPTANILLHPNTPINHGVYAVQVSYLEKNNIIGICNISEKYHNASEKKEKILEVYLFNININLYAKKIEIFLYKKIRNELYFSSLKKLKQQISKDIIAVQKYFNQQEK